MQGLLMCSTNPTSAPSASRTNSGFMQRMAARLGLQSLASPSSSMAMSGPAESTKTTLNGSGPKTAILTPDRLKARGLVQNNRSQEGAERYVSKHVAMIAAMARKGLTCE